MKIEDKRKTAAQKSREQFESLNPGDVFQAWSVTNGRFERFMKIDKGLFKSQKSGNYAEAVCLDQNYRLCHYLSDIDYKITLIESTLTLED